MKKKTITALILTVSMALSFVLNGFAQTGWKHNGDAWNYYSTDGTMAKNQWVKNGDSLFWIEEDGSMAVNKWHEHDRKWYYLGPSGAAETGWQVIDEKWYYFKEDYVMAADETIGSYYVGKDGAWDTSK